MIKDKKVYYKKCPKCGASDQLISLIIDGKREDIKYPYYKCRRIGCDWEKRGVEGFWGKLVSGKWEGGER